MESETICISETIGKLLAQRNATVATAESCTGGGIAHSITAIAGSSAYFKGSIVAYANEVKQNLLQVSPQIIEIHGAVSRECVESMSENCRKIFGTTYSIATSGIAGPSGGSAEKPIGTVWIALTTPQQTISQKHFFTGNRIDVVQQSVIAALRMLLSELK